MRRAAALLFVLGAAGVAASDTRKLYRGADVSEGQRFRIASIKRIPVGVSEKEHRALVGRECISTGNLHNNAAGTVFSGDALCDGFIEKFAAIELQLIDTLTLAKLPAVKAVDKPVVAVRAPATSFVVDQAIIEESNIATRDRDAVSKAAAAVGPLGCRTIMRDTFRTHMCLATIAAKGSACVGATLRVALREHKRRLRLGMPTELVIAGSCTSAVFATVETTGIRVTYDDQGKHIPLTWTVPVPTDAAGQAAQIDGAIEHLIAAHDKVLVATPRNAHDAAKELGEAADDVTRWLSAPKDKPDALRKAALAYAELARRDARRWMAVSSVMKDEGDPDPGDTEFAKKLGLSRSEAAWLIAYPTAVINARLFSARFAYWRALGAYAKKHKLLGTEEQREKLQADAEKRILDEEAAIDAELARRETERHRQSPRP